LDDVFADGPTLLYNPGDGLENSVDSIAQKSAADRNTSPRAADLAALASAALDARVFVLSSSSFSFSSSPCELAPFQNEQLETTLVAFKLTDKRSANL
jgi:hypothetical protein